MGAVVLARDLTLDRAVALKFLKPVVSDRFDGDRRFQQEARLLSRLSHSNVVTVYSFGEDERGVRYIAMEYVEGHTLEPRVEKDFLLPLSVAAHVIRQIGSALAEAHKRGVVHRDVKPGNILLTSQGDDNHYVKVVDFGLAKISEGAPGSASSDAGGTAAEKGMALGTPAYIAPEQALVIRVDHRADIYGLAVVVMRLLTGSHLFPGVTGATDLLVAHVTAPPALLSELGEWRGFRRGSNLEMVLSRGLAKKAEDRYQGVNQFCSALVGGITELQSDSSSEVFVVGDSNVQHEPMEYDAFNATMVGEAFLESDSSPTTWTQTAVLVVALDRLWLEDESLGGEDAIDVVATVAARLQHAVREAGGRSQGGLSDRFTAYFTSTSGVADATENAVGAALRMRQTFNELGRDPTMPRGLQPSFRILVDVGPIVSRRTLVEGELDYGRTLVRARQQVEHLSEGAVAVSNVAHRYVRGMFRYEGDAGQGGLRTVASKNTGFRARDPEIAGHPIDLIGRSEEVERLVTLALELFTSEVGGSAVVLSGVAGVGKTRLVREMLRSLDQRDETLRLEASRCTAGDEAGPYEPFAQSLRQRIRVVSTDDMNAIRVKANAFITQKLKVDDETLALDLETALVSLFGDHGQEDSVVGEAAQRGQFFEQMALLYETMSRSKPLLMLIDDFHFASGATRDLLAFLAGRMRNFPVLFVTLVRESGRELALTTLQREGLRVFDMKVEELDHESMVALIEHQLELVKEIPQGLISRILEFSHGLPLIAEETVHDLIDNGVIKVHAGYWLFTQMSLRDIQLPDTVDALFEGRVQRLPESKRLILEAAAVAGQRFWPSMLAHILGDGWSPSDLGDLESKGFVKPTENAYLGQEPAYVFVQRAMRDSTYKRVQPHDKKAIHLSVAIWLEQHRESALFQLEGAIGGHYREGGKAALAFPYLLRAAHRAVGVTALEESIAYLEACNGLLREIPSETMASEQREQASLKVLADLVRQYVAVGELQKALDASTEAEQLILPNVGPARDRRHRLALDRARALYLKGRFEESRDAFEAFGAMESADSSAVNILDAAAGYAASLGKLGMSDTALTYLSEAIDRHEGIRGSQRSSGLHMSRAYRTLGNCALEAEDFGVAAVHLKRALNIASEANAPEQSIEALNSLAALRFFRGDLAGAVVEFRAALKVAEQWDFTQHRTMLLQNLGEVLWNQGEAAESIQMLERSETMARYVGMDGILAESFRIRAEIQLAEKRYGEAERFARQAVEAADATGAPRFQAAAQLVLARSLLATTDGEGRSGSGRDALELAAALFEKSGILAQAEEIRAELASH
jgi:tetratricopeptide (TPR) repeat protein